MDNYVRPYTYQEYPKMLYHPDPEKKPVIVQNYDEERALGSDWFLTPTAAAEAMERLRESLHAQDKDTEVPRADRK